MTNERAAKIVLDFINAGEAEYRNFSVEEIIAFKKAYVALNPEPVTNADRIRAMSDEELAEYLFDRGNCQEYCYGICDIQDECNGSPSDAYCTSHIVKWLKKEVEDETLE